MDMSVTTPRLPAVRDWLQPHRIILLALLAIAIGLAVYMGEWDWLPRYLPRIISGVGVTLFMLFGSVIIGFLLAVPLGIVQVTGPWWLKAPATIFCTIFRGTPLLLQLWLLYYGLGSIFPMIPGIRSSFFWPYLREAWPYGLFALTMSLPPMKARSCAVLLRAFLQENYRRAAPLVWGVLKSSAASGFHAPLSCTANARWRNCAASQGNTARRDNHCHRHLRRHNQGSTRHSPNL